MRAKRTLDEITFGSKRPLCFKDWPPAEIRPSSFPWCVGDDPPKAGFCFPPPTTHGTARLDYEEGWTVVIFWNRDVYFVDDILTFEGIIELIRERYEPMYLQMTVRRDYGETV